jgi:hypothetical protein
MSNTGFKAYTNLEQYYVDSGVATGTTKTNSISDPDYVAPVYDTNYCPLPSLSATPTPTVSITPSITPTVTPTVTPSISVTPSIGVSLSVSVTPSKTPAVSLTPTISITPTISLTPSVTPSVSTSPSIYYHYSGDRYECVGGYCYWVESTTIANKNPINIDAGRYYYDYDNCYIFTVAYSIPPTASLITNITDAGVKNCSLLCNVICGNTP